MYDCKRPLREQLMEARKDIRELKPLVDSFIMGKRHTDRDMVVLQMIKDRVDRRYAVYETEYFKKLGKLYNYRWIRY